MVFLLEAPARLVELGSMRVSQAKFRPRRFLATCWVRRVEGQLVVTPERENTMVLECQLVMVPEDQLMEDIRGSTVDHT